jgi:phospholipase/lecithinase/hemolysin
MGLLLNLFVLLVFAGCSSLPGAGVPSPIPGLGTPFPLQKPASTLPVPSHVYAFGDSYSDNGNFYKLDPGAFDSFNWQGRSSNGPVAVEVLANELGVGLTDYAVGGAKSDTDNPNGGVYRNTGMLSQIGKFKTELNGKGADPQALYFIRIGTCDYLVKPLGIGWTDNPALTDQVVGNIAGGISELAQLGARRFLVVGPENMAILPILTSASSKMQQDAAEFQSLMASRLPSRMTELAAQLGIEITYFDALALSNRILQDPAGYGLTNVTEACVDVDIVCASPDRYYIWDTFHPTRRVHEIFGRTLAALYDNG